MDLKIIIIMLSSFLTVVAFIPYIVDILKGVTKPRIISWFLWTILSSIACVAALIEHQYPTAILMLVSAFGTLAICLLGWRFGDKDISRVDIICLSGALFGIALWKLFDSPAIAVIFMIAIDFIAGIPTLFHAWNKPNEETLTTFVLSFAGAILTLLVIENWQITSFAFPLFLVLVNFEFMLVVVLRRLFLRSKKR